MQKCRPTMFTQTSLVTIAIESYDTASDRSSDSNSGASEKLAKKKGRVPKARSYYVHDNVLQGDGENLYNDGSCVEHLLSETTQEP